MLNITVGDAQVGFNAGKLALKYFMVNFSAGQYPDMLNGSIQVTPDDGVTIASTEEQVKASALKKIQAMVADEAHEEAPAKA